MKDIEKHYGDVLALGQALPAEKVPVFDALGRVLAEDVSTRFAVPPFTNSAMDGFAVRASDVANSLSMEVTGDIPAGSTKVPDLPAGTAMRIMTGAPIPKGADSVIQVEHTEKSDENMRHEAPSFVTFTQTVRPGSNVRKRGEDVPAGQPLIPAGTRLGAGHLSALVSVGYGEVSVVRRPVIGIVTTGEELRNAGDDLAPGQIPDSNIVLLNALVTQAGGIAKPLAYHGDDPEGFEKQLRVLIDHVDMIVTAGGVSMGAFDVVKESLGEIDFCKVKMQPGKPQGFGKLKGKPVICLPGNPVSVLVSWYLFGKQLVDKIEGVTPRPFTELFEPRTVGAGWARKPGRVQLMPIIAKDGKVLPASHGGSKSHFVASTFGATGIAMVPAEVAQINAGEEIPVLWFGGN